MINEWFYMTYVLSFVKCDIFTCVIGNKNVYLWSAFDVLDPIKHKDV